MATPIQSINAPTLPTGGSTGGLKTSTPTLPTQPLSGGGSSKSFDLDSLLNIGVQVGSAISQSRAASGAKGERQARIQACGRAPFPIGVGAKHRAKVAAYKDCVAKAQSGGSDSTKAPLPIEPNDNTSGSKTMTFVYVGIGLLVVGGLAYFLLKKK